MNKATIIGLIIVLIGINIGCIEAPEVNPYDRYNLTDYNCLHIALETQEWYNLNGINTTVYLGFNEDWGHAWLINTYTGEDIVGNFPHKYDEIMTFEEWDGKIGYIQRS